MSYSLKIVDSNDLGIDDLIPEPLLQVAYLSRSRYTLGTEGVSMDRMDEIRDDKSLFKLPVYAYIHSGVCLSTGPFGDRFDSGMSGFVYAERKYLAEQFGHKRWNQHTKRRAIEAAECVVQEVSDILGGEVYGYQIVDDVTGEEVDSCYGYVGRKNVEEAGAEALKYLEART